MAPHVAPVPFEFLCAELLILLSFAAILGLLPALLGQATTVVSWTTEAVAHIRSIVAGVFAAPLRRPARSPARRRAHARMTAIQTAAPAPPAIFGPVGSGGGSAVQTMLATQPGSEG